jgi:hypothetical protein
MNFSETILSLFYFKGLILYLGGHWSDPGSPLREIQVAIYLRYLDVIAGN